MKHKTTINDIAELAGVSKATVSFFLNGKYDKMSEQTCERIRQAIEDTGYHPSVAARTLNSKSAHLYGVIIGNITKTFANNVVKGIEDFANENDFMTIVASSEFSPERERTYIKSMLALGVDGFLIQPTVNFDEIYKVMRIDKPIVFFDSAPPSRNQMYVKTDNYDSVKNATIKLLEKGYSYFVIVSNNPYVLQTRIERVKGCIDVLESRDINHELIIINGEATADDLAGKLRPLLDSRSNACVFAMNSNLLELTYAAMEPYLDRIPEIGLIGFDDERWCRYVSPSITTISQPAYEEGYTAGKVLMDAIRGEQKAGRATVLHSTLIERDSTDLKKE